MSGRQPEGYPADECKHGLDPRWCSTCLHGPSKPFADTIEATFTARYDGDCRGCDLPIRVGQTVHKLASGAYVHKGCE